MIPPEAHGHLCLLLWAHDETSKWQMGLIRIQSNFLGAPNRDGKASLNLEGRQAITWIFSERELPPNVLLHLDREVVDRIMALKSGQQRINELFRNALGLQKPRNGESIAIRLAAADPGDLDVIRMEGKRYRIAREGDPVTTASKLPRI